MENDKMMNLFSNQPSGAPNLLKALNENTNTQGGFLVPQIWAARIYELIVAKATAIQLCEQITMTSDTLFFPKVATATTAYWPGEDATVTQSQPTFSQIALHPKKVAAITLLSTEVMEDSNPSILNVITERLAIDIALAVDSEIYNGTANYTGFRSATNTLSTLVDGAISLANISDAIYQLRKNNIYATDFICHPAVTNQLRKLKDTNNRPLLDEITFMSAPTANGQVGKIFGLNVIETTQLPINLTGTGTVTQNGTDALVVCRGKCGIFANRRQMNLNKFYQIQTDDWLIQSNMRAAFSVNYENAICAVRLIQVS